MPITIMAFGKAAEIIGRNELLLEGISDTKELEKFLSEQYPIFKSLPYRVAVNKRIIDTITTLAGDEKVALLPPFSGG